jgi:hypothetical protein
VSFSFFPELKKYGGWYNLAVYAFFVASVCVSDYTVIGCHHPTFGISHWY